LKSQPLTRTLSSAKQAEDVEGEGSENLEDLGAIQECGKNSEKVNNMTNQMSKILPKMSDL